MAKLLYNRAFAWSKFGRIRDAIKDCTKVIMKSSCSYAKVLHLRAKCYLTMRNFSKCVKDYEELLKIEKSDEVELLLNEARTALKRSRSNNHYDVLDIERNATQAAIKKAYKKLTLIHHPDKHSDAPDDERLEQQEMFKKISVAYDVLSTPRKREDYDDYHNAKN